MHSSNKGTHKSCWRGEEAQTMTLCNHPRVFKTQQKTEIEIKREWDVLGAKGNSTSVIKADP